MSELLRFREEQSSTRLRYAYTDPVHSGGETASTIDYTITSIPSTSDGGTSGTLGETGSLGVDSELTSGQRNAVQAFQRRDDTPGALITCETGLETVSEEFSPVSFARKVVQGIDCLHYTHTESASGSHTFQWIIGDGSDQAIRQLTDAITLFLFISRWTGRTNPDRTVERVLYDGTVVFNNGKTLQSPYTLTRIGRERRCSLADE